MEDDARVVEGVEDDASEVAEGVVACDSTSEAGEVEEVEELHRL